LSTKNPRQVESSEETKARLSGERLRQVEGRIGTTGYSPPPILGYDTCLVVKPLQNQNTETPMDLYNL
jgi:hypothetical protein